MAGGDGQRRQQGQRLQPQRLGGLAPLGDLVAIEDGVGVGGEQEIEQGPLALLRSSM